MALRSCEAEYVSSSFAAQEAVYLQGLLTFLCFMTVDTAVPLCRDNQRALVLASNPFAHKRGNTIKPDTTSSVTWLRTNAFNCLMSPKRTTCLISSPRTYASLLSMSSHRNSLSFSHFNPQFKHRLPHNSIILLYLLLCLFYK